jgi:hypothetical protein
LKPYTLRWLNRIREAHSLAPVGHIEPWHGCRDPIESTMRELTARVAVDSMTLITFPGAKVYALPLQVRHFVAKCDTGHYPLLGSTVERCPQELHRPRCVHSTHSRFGRTLVRPAER